MTDRQPDLFSLVAELRRRGEPFSIATVVRTENATSAKAGAKAVVLKDGSIHGHLGGGCILGALKRSSAAVLEDGKPRLIRVRPSDEVVELLDVDGVELHKSACPSGGTVDIFVEPLRPPPRLAICGASPVALALADLAPRLGYEVVACALPDDMNKLDPAVTTHQGFDLADLDLGARDYVVVATQGKRDREALAAALASQAGYIAFVGSRRKVAVLTARPQDLGVTQARLRDLHAPAGLNIRAIEPAEIALSILGEMISHRRSGIRENAQDSAIESDEDERRGER
jgi:xanthine dehydrogenase accessory factor